MISFNVLFNPANVSIKIATSASDTIRGLIANVLGANPADIECTVEADAHSLSVLTAARKVLRFVVTCEGCEDMLPGDLEDTAARLAEQSVSTLPDSLVGKGKTDFQFNCDMFSTTKQM